MYLLLRGIGLFGLFVLTMASLTAHVPDHSYIYLRIYEDGIAGRYELSSEFINAAIGSELFISPRPEELEPHLPEIHAYLRQKAGFSVAGRDLPIRFEAPAILTLPDSDDYISFPFVIQDVGEIPDRLDVRYAVLFDQDPRHRGLLIIEHHWRMGIHENEAAFTNVFEPGKPEQTLDLTNASIWRGLWTMVKLGVWHIWIGLDHILFIIALILPSVLRRIRRKPHGWFDLDQWEGVGSFRAAFFYLIRVITFFTVAHSITLALASLEVFTPPSKLVEAIIAFSIGLAALHNLYPIFRQTEWVIAFGFGLFHGFGFASVLGEKGLGGDYLLYSLLGFNLGVELGQLLIIFLVFPLLFLLRKTRFYRYLLLVVSLLLIGVAGYWTIERAFS